MICLEKFSFSKQVYKQNYLLILLFYKLKSEYLRSKDNLK